MKKYLEFLTDIIMFKQDRFDFINLAECSRVININIS